MTTADLFPLLCRLLALDPCPDGGRNGTLEGFSAVLRAQEESVGQQVQKKIKEVVELISSPQNLPVAGVSDCVLKNRK